MDASIYFKENVETLSVNLHIRNYKLLEGYGGITLIKGSRKKKVLEHIKGTSLIKTYNVATQT